LLKLCGRRKVSSVLFSYLTTKTPPIDLFARGSRHQPGALPNLPVMSCCRPKWLTGFRACSFLSCGEGRNSQRPTEGACSWSSLRAPLTVGEGLGPCPLPLAVTHHGLSHRCCPPTLEIVASRSLCTMKSQKRNMDRLTILFSGQVFLEHT
jgi:hypothetical protein